MNSLPSGTVTFLFTDIEGSTRRWEQFPRQMEVDLPVHDAILRKAIESNGGYVFKTIGDAFCAAFPTAPQALAAAIDAQRDIAEQEWETARGAGPIQVRMALHTGAAAPINGDYSGPTFDRVARLLTAGHGGQTLLSPTSQELVRNQLPDGVELADMGVRRLVDLTNKEHIFQLIIPGIHANYRPLKTLEGNPNNLPVRSSPLVGREKEVKACLNLLRQKNVRLLTLVGPGGTGKTRLALQVAAEILEEFSDGVFAVGLAPIKDPSVVASTIAAALGVREAGGQHLTDTLKDYLRDKQMLLLLDNFEQLLEAAPLVWELLATAPRLKVLATSRASLGLSAEHEYFVPPMSLPDPDTAATVETASQYEAVALFVASATAVKPDFRLTPENAAAVTQICVRLEGLPLAIELAAARVKVLPPQALLARLESRLKLLTGGARDLPARQQTMRDTLAWSYDLLDPGEQAVFRRLSVFSRGCTMEAAEVLCDFEGAPDVLDAISSLVNKSLMRQMPNVGHENSDTRFSMLEIIREFGLEQLEQSGERDMVREEHARFFVALAEKAEPELAGPREAEWLERLDAEQDNMRAVLEWANERGEAELALRLASSLWRFWYMRSNLSEGRKWLIGLLGLPQARAKTPLRAKALNGGGNMVYNQGDYDAAQMLHEESLAISREMGDERGIAGSLNNLGLIARSRGDYARARALFEEARETNKRMGNRNWEAINLNNLGTVLHQQGDYEQAYALEEQSLALFTSMGDQSGIAMALGDLGRIVSDQGKYAQARDFYHRSLIIQKRLGDKRNIAALQEAIGVVAAKQGDFAEAQRLCEQSLAMFREMGDKRGIGTSLHQLGNVYLHRGQYDKARACYEESLAIRRQLRDKWSIAYSLNNLGLVALRTGELDEAQSLLDQSVAMWREVDNKVSIATALLNLGLLAASRPDYAAAQTYLEESLAISTGLGDREGIGISLVNLGFVARGRHDYDTAKDFYERALTTFRELGDRRGIFTALLGLGCIEAALEHGEQAARIFGAAKRLSEEIDIPIPPFEQPYYEPAMAAARAQAGSKAFSTAFDEGQAMSLDEAMDALLGKAEHA